MTKTQRSLWHIFWLLIAVPLSAFAAQQLWGWFIVPITGWPVLTMLQAMGLALTIKYFVLNVSVPVEKEDSENIKIAMHILAPSISLFAGWIIHLAM